MPSESLTTERGARMKAERTRFHSWKRGRLRRGIPAELRRRTCRVGAAAALLLVASAALLPATPNESRFLCCTTADLVRTPAGRAVLVEGVAVTEDEILWLARAIYSETKRPHEQELVAWVVRNRVETRYRGNSTYREAILDPFQFSAFNRDTRTRAFYMHLDWNATSPGFQTALVIASKVLVADARERPFSLSTRHFYSARSMTTGRAPAWAENRYPVSLDRDVDAERFRFYERIA